MNALDRRFWDKVTIGDGCWEWQAGKTSGYGVFWLDGKTPIFAHRFACEKVYGPLGKSLATHGCDNRGCVRPGCGHVRPGTHESNMAECAKRGRQDQKLPPETVLAIREAAGLQKEIALAFGVSKTTVSLIRRHDTRPDVGGPVHRREWG